LNDITDAHVRDLFAANQDLNDMSVYEGAEVKVHTNQEVLDPVLEFPNCGVRNEILLAVAELGFKNPTNVQKYAIPYVLAGHDVLVTAQTGSGKTAAYMLPVISLLMGQRTTRDPSVIVLVPTRELALQIQKQTDMFIRGADLRTVCIFGGASIGDQVRQLRFACNILIATPGRLIDIMER
jgi:superfamily II DNA/RNA helicase